MLMFNEFTYILFITIINQAATCFDLIFINPNHLIYTFMIILKIESKLKLSFLLKKSNNRFLKVHLIANRKTITLC